MRSGLRSTTAAVTLLLLQGPAAAADCVGQADLRPNPTEPLSRGPYGVGARTIAGGISDRNL